MTDEMMDEMDAFYTARDFAELEWSPSTDDLTFALHAMECEHFDSLYCECGGDFRLIPNFSSDRGSGEVSLFILIALVPVALFFLLVALF